MQNFIWPIALVIALYLLLIKLAIDANFVNRTQLNFFLFLELDLFRSKTGNYLCDLGRQLYPWLMMILSNKMDQGMKFAMFRPFFSHRCQFTFVAEDIERRESNLVKSVFWILTLYKSRARKQRCHNSGSAVEYFLSWKICCLNIRNLKNL